jgi:hypothetical protein
MIFARRRARTSRINRNEGRSRAVSEGELQQRMLEAYGIRIEPEMIRYVLRRLQQAGGAAREMTVIGGEAKTGMPRRVVVDPSNLVHPVVSTPRRSS